MKKFSIRVVPRSFEKTASNALVGQIWIELAGKAFPDGDWSDFLVILSRWLTAVGDLRSPRTKSATLGFMEGPYQIQIAKAEDGTVVLTPQDRRGRNVEVPHVATVELAHVLEEMRTAAVLVIESCREKQIDSADLKELVAASKTTAAK